MRTKFNWTVQLQSATGEITDEKVSAFWSPEHETTREAIGHVAMVQAWLRSGKRTESAAQAFAPLSVTLA